MLRKKFSLYLIKVCFIKCDEESNAMKKCVAYVAPFFKSKYYNETAFSFNQITLGCKSLYLLKHFVLFIDGRNESESTLSQLED